MHPENYPAQDTFTEIGEKYHARVMDQVDKVPTVEWQHGDDPYQSVAVYPSDTARGDILILLHDGLLCAGLDRKRYHCCKCGL